MFLNFHYAKKIFPSICPNRTVLPIIILTRKARYSNVKSKTYKRYQQTPLSKYRTEHHALPQMSEIIAERSCRKGRHQQILSGRHRISRKYKAMFPGNLIRYRKGAPLRSRPASGFPGCHAKISFFPSHLLLIPCDKKVKKGCCPFHNIMSEIGSILYFCCMAGAFHFFTNFSSHSLGRNPIRTKSSPTRIGRFPYQIRKSLSSSLKIASIKK